MSVLRLAAVVSTTRSDRALGSCSHGMCSSTQRITFDAGSAGPRSRVVSKISSLSATTLPASPGLSSLLGEKTRAE